MKHIQFAETKLPEEFIIRATGRFYTHEVIASQLIGALINQLRNTVRDGDILNICDPFAGDGRLVHWLFEHWRKQDLPEVKWRVILWDINANGLSRAATMLDETCERYRIVADIECLVGDAFHIARRHKNVFDIVITNPPWELLKPDSRELDKLPSTVRENYITAMREYDQTLSTNFPDSQPVRKFAGWGTNLSRVGLDLSRFICRADGHVAIVMPASFMADDMSLPLRRAFLKTHHLVDAAFFPAEAKLFGRADVSTSTLLFKMGKSNEIRPMLTAYKRDLQVESRATLHISPTFLERFGYILPISFGAGALKILERFAKQFDTWHDLEGKGPNDLWAGRELDETGSKNWLRDDGEGLLFIKGRMIDRFAIRTPPVNRVGKMGWEPSSSIAFERIAWRDVSRPNQKRRLIAMIIPPGVVAGNSLGIAHFRDGNRMSLLALLGVMSSVCFEFQLRSHLATGHVSLSSLRKVYTPSRKLLEKATSLISAVERSLIGSPTGPTEVEAIVAKQIYGLTRKELELVLGLFPKLTKTEKIVILGAYDELP